MRTRLVLACLLVISLASGCTSVVAGTALPAAGLAPQLVTGEAIKDVLLDSAALAKILGQDFTAKSELPPRFGGPEKLQEAFGRVSRVDCLGITTMLAKSAYQSARRSGSVENVARETWWNSAGPAKVISVAEGVVALSGPDEAAELFESFTQQWDSCDGAMVTIASGKVAFADKITDVRITNSVLAATVSIGTRISGSQLKAARPEARAIGLRGNCLVEVEIAFFSVRGPADKGSADINTSAIEIAHAMMERVSNMS